MKPQRVLMIGLDGYEPTLARRLMDEGRLPSLARLQDCAARFSLDHGGARRTGLAWEHVSTGLTPEAAGRFAAVDFDPARYEVWQRPTRLPPFAASLPGRTVVFDAPYFDLARAPSAQGLVAWGAHDPGVAAASRPEGLAAEVEARFGPYPATDWIYGFAWPSVARTVTMGRALVAAVERRAEIAEWLLTRRLPDWELGYLVVAELHSGTEALWHGVDPAHPLAGQPSAAPAGEALVALYEALDRLVGRLAAACPDAALVVFTPHGMGPNHGDVPSMILLPELLYRAAFGRPFLAATADPAVADAAMPPLAEEQSWNDALRPPAPPGKPRRTPWQRLRRRLGLKPPPRPRPEPPGPGCLPLDWMPAAWYREAWPRMPAFAVPAFYEGRVRVNLAGREARGLVAPADLARRCDEIEALLTECRDPATGEPVVERFERPGGDPLTLPPSEADLTVVWHHGTLGLVHPRLGRVGPVPWRRPGGHTGGDGIAYFTGTPLAPGDHGRTSAFDVVPTVLALLGAPPGGVSGRSLLERDGVVESLSQKG